MPERLFTGTYEHRIDERGRLAIPSQFRGGFGYGGVLLPGPDNQIELHTADGYERIKDERLNPSDQSRRARLLRRAMFGRAVEVSLDRQGRITIPVAMREKRGIDGATNVVGMGEYLEIWSEDAWAAESSEVDEVFAELLEGLDRIIATDSGDTGDDEAES